MTRLDLKALQPTDVLNRLGPQESDVCLLSSYTVTGWDKLVAWRPQARWSYDGQTPEQALHELEAFVTNQAGKLLIGYLSYDFGCALHGVPLQARVEMKLPQIMVYSFDNWLAFDKNQARLVAKQASFSNEVRAILQRPLPAPIAEPYNSKFSFTQPRAYYHRGYQAIAGYIRAGDAYQVNLAHKLRGSTAYSGRQLFSYLSSRSTADFQAYMEVKDHEILSLSPERFIKVERGVVTTMPIKGTRPRGRTPAEDKKLQAELLNSAKEKAELDMITDLMRNDLGKVCQPGSVKVAEARQLTAYPKLWHTHSTIRGRLRSDVSPIASLASVLPGGSISGCPKKRALEIINELEPERRGVYTGSIFVIRPNGSLDSSILIRTILKHRQHLAISLGGGIVYDSTEAGEYQELLDKAASFVGGNKSLSKLI